MSETGSAATQEETRQNREGATAKKRARVAEFPDAPQDASPGSVGQLDILLDMEVPVTVVLGATQISVRRLLQLGPDSVLKLDKPVEAPADLFLKDSKFAEADVVVVEDRFAARIRRITGAGIPTNPSTEQEA